MADINETVAEMLRLDAQATRGSWDYWFLEGYRAGQEAMRERCASRAARDADGSCSCGRPICQPDCARVRLLDLADAIRALEVER